MTSVEERVEGDPPGCEHLGAGGHVLGGEEDRDPNIEMEMAWLALLRIGWNLVDVEVEEVGIPWVWLGISDTTLLAQLAEGRRTEVDIIGLDVSARLDPDPEEAMMDQENVSL